MLQMGESRTVLRSSETNLHFKHRLKYFGIFSYLYFVLPYLVFRKKSSFALFHARAHSSSSPGLQSPFSAREHASFGLGLWPTET